MSDFKQIAQTKISRLPLFNGIDSSEIQLIPQEWKKGEKPVFNIVRILGLIGIGYVVWTILLPFIAGLAAGFYLIGQVVAIVGSILLIYACRKPLKGIVKSMIRKFHEFWITNDPFGAFREQRVELVQQYEDAVGAGTIISQSKETMKSNATKNQLDAKKYQDRLIEISEEAVKLNTEIEKFTTEESKEDPEYADLCIQRNDLAMEYQRVEMNYEQAKDLITQFGTRASVFTKFETQYKYFVSYLKNRVKNFDSTVQILKNDFEATSAMRAGTDAVKNVLNFNDKWEVQFASEVVLGAIANNIATTKNNLQDIKDAMGNINIGDPSKSFNQLDKLVANIKAGTDIIPSAKRFNNPDLKLTAEEKDATGGIGGIF